MIAKTCICFFCSLVTDWKWDVFYLFCSMYSFTLIVLSYSRGTVQADIFIFAVTQCGYYSCLAAQYRH